MKTAVITYMRLLCEAHLPSTPFASCFFVLRQGPSRVSCNVGCRLDFDSDQSSRFRASFAFRAGGSQPQESYPHRWAYAVCRAGLGCRNWNPLAIPGIRQLCLL